MRMEICFDNLNFVMDLLAGSSLCFSKKLSPDFYSKYCQLSFSLLITKSYFHFEQDELALW